MTITHHDAIDNRTGQPARLSVDDGFIVSLESIETDPSSLPRLLPPLLDIQVNGYAGVDFEGDTAGIRDLETAVGGLADAACNRFLVTVITDRYALPTWGAHGGKPGSPHKYIVNPNTPQERVLERGKFDKEPLEKGDLLRVLTAGGGGWGEGKGGGGVQAANCRIAVTQKHRVDS